MIRIFIIINLCLLSLLAAAGYTPVRTADPLPDSGYLDVNGLHMYYEMHGAGDPLVLIHGGGSTIQTTFGRIMPQLAKTHRVIALELQAHGHTGDRKADLSFQQDADDVAGALAKLGIQKADFLGFSNGGQTLIELWLRHSRLVNRMILASTFYSRDAADSAFWEGFDQAKLSQMPKALQEAFLSVNKSPAALQNMFDKDVRRMKGFKGWSDSDIASISCPVLVICGNHDVGSVEHSVKMYKLMPKAKLAVFPGYHGDYLGVLETLKDGKMPEFNAVSLIDSFFSEESK